MLLGGAFRGAARCVARRRAPASAFLTTGRAVLISKRVCVRAGRAAGLALWAGRKTSTAQLFTGETLLACERRPWKAGELFWLVALTLRIKLSAPPLRFNRRGSHRRGRGWQGMLNRDRSIMPLLLLN